MLNEEWRSVVGHEGRYEVSNTGRLRSLNYNKTGHVRELRAGSIRRGYPSAEIFNDDGTSRMRTIHSLVAEAFIGQRPGGYTVNHIDGNKRNAAADNLEYCTLSDNRKHAFRVGLQSSKGENHSGHKLTESDVRAVRKMLSDGLRQNLIASKFGVNPSVVSYIKSGRNWSHVI